MLQVVGQIGKLRPLLAQLGALKGCTLHKWSVVFFLQGRFDFIFLMSVSPEIENIKYSLCFLWLALFMVILVRHTLGLWNRIVTGDTPFGRRTFEEHVEAVINLSVDFLHAAWTRGVLREGHFSVANALFTFSGRAWVRRQLARPYQELRTPLSASGWDYSRSHGLVRRAEAITPLLGWLFDSPDWSLAFLRLRQRKFASS